MRLDGFIGPAYKGKSVNVAAQSLYNWMPQSVEAQDTARIVYYPRPGHSTFVVLPTSPVRAVFQQDGRNFAVGGQQFYEISDSGVITPRGTLTAKDTSPATINSSGTAGHQLYITSGGFGDIFDLNTNAMTKISALGYPTNTVMGTYLDTYFLTTQGGTAQFNISDPLDGLVWSSLDFAIRIQASDNLVAIIQFNKLIWLIGSQTSEPWYNSGAASFPFQSVPQVLIPMGTCAPFSVTRTSQALCWLHQSERGRGIFVAAADYNPKRISTYAIEAIWATYPKLSDCVAYGLTWEGHELLIVNFPSGNATWAYDFGEQLWHQWSWFNQTTGAHDRFRGWVHCQAFNGHLVGDWETGEVHWLDGALADDSGNPIVWERASPHMNREKTFNFYGNFQLDTETGLGGSTPIARLAWSDDGGHTYSKGVDMNLGAAGQYPTRCRAAGNLGRSRDRVFRVRVSNDVPPSGVIGAYIDVTAGTS